MNYPNFILKEDWYLDTEIMGQKNKSLLFKKGHKFSANENGEYIIETISGRLVLNTEGMRLANNGNVTMFREDVSNFEIVIEEITDEDDILVSNWRIQLDVKTTRKKLKEVQRIIDEYVRPIL